MARIAITSPMRADYEAALSRVGARKSDSQILRQPSRSPHIVELRRRIAAVLRAKGYSFNEIAALLGYKDHTTVMHLLAAKPRDPREWVWYPDLGVWKPKPLPGRRAFDPHP